MSSAEEVIKAFRDFAISRKKFELFTDKVISYQKFHYIMTFAKKKGRITPAQKRELELVAEKLEKAEGIDLSIPAGVLREFLKNVKVETKGNKGR